jgi:hypothetical protein
MTKTDVAYDDKFRPWLVSSATRYRGAAMTRGAGVSDNNMITERRKMANLILPGTEKSRQQRREKARFIQEHLPEILDNFQVQVNLLLARCDVIDECLRMLGIDDAKFKTAVQAINIQQQLLQSQAIAAQKLAQQ